MRDTAIAFEVTREQMEDEEDYSRIQACFPPESPKLAHEVYQFLSQRAQSASKFIGGMGVSFIGLDFEALEKVAKNFYGLDITRFKTHLDHWEKKSREVYKRKT